MRVRHLIVGAALGAILGSVVPVSADAAGAKDSRPAASDERGAVGSGRDSSRLVTTPTGISPSLNSHAAFESILSRGNRRIDPTKSGGPDHDTIESILSGGNRRIDPPKFVPPHREMQQVHDLREFTPVAVQRGRCHPRHRGRDDHDDDRRASGRTTTVAFFDDHDRRPGHSPHDPHDPHGPPFCPSPH